MYLSQAEFESFIKRDLTTDEAVSFVILEGAAEKFIDDYTGTNFNDVTETSRYYDGGVKEIDIDPCTSVTKIEYVDEDLDMTSEFDDDVYVLEPINNTVKWSIRSRFGNFLCGVNNVKLTAKFSSYVDSVPSEIKLAVSLLTQGMINNPSGYKKESLEGYSYELGDIAESNSKVYTILSSYRRIMF